ncbi:MAG: Maf family protein [Spirochaetia bacterium]
MTHPTSPDNGVPRLILASGSPRRRELLNQIGINHEVIPPHLNEEAFIEDDPVRLVQALAAAKAEVVRAAAPGASQRWILAADTVVAVAGQILGKPSDRAQAAVMIRKLSRRTHSVMTAIAIWPPGVARPTVKVAETSVSFANLTAAEIEHYLGKNDWEDVAGAYRIQGRASLYIERISGSYSNVVGLPIHLVYSILTEHGYPSLR